MLTALAAFGALMLVVAFIGGSLYCAALAAIWWVNWLTRG
jgi:hypothetical protein